MNSAAPVWRLLHEAHDPSAPYSSNPRTDLLALLDRKVTRALELGCGSGATGRQLKCMQPQAHVVGIERDQQAATAARMHLDQVIEADLDQIDFTTMGWKPGAFDLLVAGDVLEHVVDPWHLLEKLRPYLADACLLLISIPNIANAWIISQLAAGRWEYEAEGLLDVTHLRFFTRATAERLLTETGYRVETMVRIPDHRIPPWPHGPKTVSADLDIGGVVLKGMTRARWDDFRTLQYLLRAHPMSSNSPSGPQRKKRKVAVLSFDRQEYACADIRILAPFKRLEDEFEIQWAVQFDDAGSDRIDHNALEAADLIVVQRFFPTQETMPLLEQLKADDKILVYETDDLLTDTPESNPHHLSLSKQRPYIEQCVRLADAVIVSTTSLKEAYASLNSNIFVWPNYIDESLWRPLSLDSDPQSPVRVLYAGTLTHAEDLSIVLPALQRLHAVHGDAIRFIFMGMTPSQEINLGETEVLPFEPAYRSYAEILRQARIDLAIVPLADNSFNRSKSPIKWLEYSALGIPAVFSDLAPYAIVEHGRTGMRVSNTTDEWYASVDALIRDPIKRREIGKAAQAEVLENWSLSKHADAYRSIYSTAQPKRDNQATIQIPAFREDVARDWISRKHSDIARSLQVVIRVNGTSDHVSSTIDAFERQWLSPAKVVEIDAASPATVNSALESAQQGWTLILRQGDIVSEDFLLLLTQAISVHPEWGLIYFDEAQQNGDEPFSNPHYKPDFNLDYLRSLPYTGTALAVRKDVFERLGGFHPAYEGCEEYDFMLRAYELVGAEGIGHVSGALVAHDPSYKSGSRPLDAVLAAARQALEAHLRRLDISAQVEPGPLPATSRVRYRHDAQPLVSIIIPTRNQREVLQRCLESLLSRTAWPNYEILIVDNGSDEAEAVQYLEGLKALENELNGRLRVLDYPHPFNYSAMNNLAVQQTRGDYLLLLNNDTAVLHEDWLDAMMSHAQRPEVGVVGAKLLYPDGTVQHAGVILGMKGPAEHVYIGQDAKSSGYYGRLQLDQNLSAVTGACLLVRKSLFEQVGGLDEEALAVSYSDIDLCLKITKQGKLIVWTPYAVLMHEGSKSQTSGVEAASDPVKARRFAEEQAVMYRRWLPEMATDPAYNRCLSLATTDVVPEPDPALRWDPDWRPVPRVITQPADREGCGEYRIIAPTRALANAGLIQGEASQRIYTPPELARLRPDALVLQRQIEDHQLEAMERHKRFNDLFCVYEIDDLVTNLPVKSVHKRHLPKDMYKRLRRATGLCDRLVVATEVLAEAYAGLSDDVRVAPNYIEEARWGHLAPLRGVGSQPRVGWAGGIGHSGDLDLIAGVVETLKDEVDWVFMGMCPERLRPFVKEFHPPVALDDYPAKLASLDLDLALAPLEDVPFNHAKSHLRLLEYGILGYPVVCSDLTPYQGGFPVTRVRNRHRDWVEAIRAHVTELDAAHQAGNELRAHIKAHWLLERNLEVWQKAWLPD